MSDLELAETQLKLSLEFWREHWDTPREMLYNMDETAILYEEVPRTTWAVKGRASTARVKNLTKHPGRLTAVMTIRSDGIVFFCC
jgi:hypothetical protein